MMTRGLFFAGFCVALAACASADDPVEDPCEPDATRPCDCAGAAGERVAICLPSGAWSACDCGADAGGDGPLGPPRDGTTVDFGATRDARVAPEAGRDAARVDPDAEPRCEPTAPGVELPEDHLQGHWPLDGDANDRSVHGNHCAPAGNARFADDPTRGRVLELDGAGSYLDCGNRATLEPGPALTVAAWVRVRSFRAEWQAFFARNGEDCGWTLRRDSNQAGVDFALRGTAAVDDLRGATRIDDGAWHHLAGVYDGSLRQLFVDGEQDAHVPDSGAIGRCGADHVLIGAMGAESFGYGHGSHDGWIDDVRMYDTALGPAQIRLLAGRDRGVSDPGPRDGAACADPATALSWSPAAESCRYHVYLGTNRDEVANADDPARAPGRGTHAGTTYQPGPLEPHTPYFWRIDAVTPDGVDRGPVWSFRVCGEVSGGFVRVPAGSFTMGSSPGDNAGCREGCGWPFDIEKPHAVNITRDLWVKATEVTLGEWFAATGQRPGVFSACGDDCPVENVTWWQAVAYCNQRSSMEGLPPCYFTDAGGAAPYDLEAGNRRAHPHWVLGPACEGYRLPTESEWEYFARAGTTTPVFLGDATDANVAQIAWYGQNSACNYAACDGENCRQGAGGIPPSGPHPGATRLPNPWGVYDAAGNVWELVWDFFGEYPDGPVDDPVGPVAHQAGFHVARGGSWLNSRVEARASTRDGDDSTCDPDNGPGSHTGFRIVRTAR